MIRLLKLSLAPLVFAISAACAYAQPAVKIGFLTDLSSTFSDIDGKGGATAIQMAIEDFGGKVLGKDVELLVADHQNKADVGAAKAREWVDTQHVTALFAGPNSAVALAVNSIARDKKRVYFNNAAATPVLTNEQCTPYTVHYVKDTVALARGTGAASMDSSARSWYFLTADYAFGQALEADTAAFVRSKGGTVLGSARHPLNAADMSSFLLQAQTSKASILALANGGNDTLSAIRTAKQFGIDKTMKIVAMSLFTSDIHGLGLASAAGLLFTTGWDWSLDENTRAFGRKFFARTGRMPTEVQAAGYSATMTYLKAVAAVGTTDADKVMAQLKSTPVNDFYANGVIRPDGRLVKDLYLMQVKSPAESKGPWDYAKVVKTLSGADLFTSKAESKCALWKS